MTSSSGTLVDAFSMLGQTHKAVTVLKEMARQYEKSGLLHERDDCYREILTMDPDDDSAAERVRPSESAHEGVTIEFDSQGEQPVKPAEDAAAPPPLPPPLPPLPEEEDTPGKASFKTTMAMSTGEKCERSSSRWSWTPTSRSASHPRQATAPRRPRPAAS